MMYGTTIIIVSLLHMHVTETFFDNEIHLKCFGRTFKNVSLTAYYPDYESEDGFRDIKGVPLRTLQDYLDDRAQFITLSMDKNLNMSYGTPVCIPELNKHFGHRLRIQVRDTCSDLTGSGYSRADICVRSETDSYDITINRMVSLVFDLY